MSIDLQVYKRSITPTIKLGVALHYQGSNNTESWTGISYMSSFY